MAPSTLLVLSFRPPLFPVPLANSGWGHGVVTGIVSLAYAIVRRLRGDRVSFFGGRPSRYLVAVGPLQIRSNARHRFSNRCSAASAAKGLLDSKSHAWRLRGSSARNAIRRFLRMDVVPEPRHTSLHYQIIGSTLTA